MSKGKYASKRGKSSKSLALVLSLVLLITATVGGTLAWLTDTTEKVENTFTIGDINIGLTESEIDNQGKRDYLFVPGQTLPKDPKVTVEYGSEDCYLFIKIKEANNTPAALKGEKIINWSVLGHETDSGNMDPTTGWVKHTVETTGDAKYYYYYRTLTDITDPNTTDSDTNADFQILTKDEVTVNPKVTKDMVTAINGAKPTLSFWAAAIQKDNLAPAEGQNVVDFAFSKIVWPEE